MDLYNTFPRVMGNPKNRQLVKSKQERNAYIKKWYRKRPIYISVYAFREVFNDDLYKTHQTAIVDKIVFDFDKDYKYKNMNTNKLISKREALTLLKEIYKDEERIKPFDNINVKRFQTDPYGNMISFHNFLMDRDIMHRIKLSGNGFHITFAIEENLKHPKVAISNYWDYIANRCIKDEKDFYENPFNPDKQYKDTPSLDICSSTRGDLGQIIRYPNTKNFKAKCFCIPIDDYLLARLHSLEEFQEFAQKPYKHKGNTTFGRKKLDISEFDCDQKQFDEIGGFLTLSRVSMGDVKTDENVNIDFNILPYCMKNLIFNHKLHFRERNEVIKFFVNRSDIPKPYTESEMLGIFKRISEYDPWISWFFTFNVEWILYRNIKVVMDNKQIRSGCRKIAMMGYCNRTKCHWKNITIRKEAEIDEEISNELDALFDDF